MSRLTRKEMDRLSELVDARAFDQRLIDNYMARPGAAASNVIAFISLNCGHWEKSKLAQYALQKAINAEDLRRAAGYLGPWKVELQFPLFDEGAERNAIAALGVGRRNEMDNCLMFDTIQRRIILAMKYIRSHSQNLANWPEEDMRKSIDLFLAFARANRYIFVEPRVVRALETWLEQFGLHAIQDELSVIKFADESGETYRETMQATYESIRDVAACLSDSEEVAKFVQYVRSREAKWLNNVIILLAEIERVYFDDKSIDCALQWNRAYGEPIVVAPSI